MRQSMETRMDPWSDQRRDSAKILMWGIEMDRLKAHRMETLMRQSMETRMDPLLDQWRIASMEQLKETQMGGMMDNWMKSWMDSAMEDEKV